MVGTGVRGVGSRRGFGLVLVAALLAQVVVFAQAASARELLAAPRLSSDAAGSLTVAWDVPSPVPVDYRVMWAPEDGSWLSYRDANESERGNLYPAGGGGESSLTITGLTPGVRYKVAMRARYGGGVVGPWSRLAVLAARAAPAEEQATATVEVLPAAKDGSDGGTSGGPIPLEPSGEQTRSSRSGLVARQTATALVTNMGQADGSSGPIQNDYHQPFTTGDNTAGYTITKIEMNVGTAGSTVVIPAMSIWPLSGTALGTTKVGDLTSPGDLAVGAVAWTSTGIDLAANTAYTILLDSPDTSNANGNFARTASDSEDTGAASGWSIANSSYLRSRRSSTNTWITVADPNKIRITGTAKTGTSTNTAPVFNPTSVTRTLAENTAAGTDVGLPVSATDTDTGALAYTLSGADAGSFDIVSSSGQIRTKTGVTYDYEAKTSYTVTVTATDTGSLTATAAVTINVTDISEPPAAPAAPTVAATTGAVPGLSVSWAAPANTGKPAIAGYDLQYRQTGTTAWTNGPQDQTGTTATIGSLTASTAYEVQVRATNDEGDSAWSPSGTATTGAGTPTNTAPGAPTGLTATARGPARIDLAWTAPASTGGAAISGYKVEVSTNGGTSFTDLAVITVSTTTTFSHTGLSANSTRHYRVSATNSVGTGPASDTAFDVTNVLVRNIAQGNHADEDTVLGLSQRFTTGSNVGGYTLAAVEVVSGDTAGDDFTAQIFAVDTASGHPTGSARATLVAPTSFAAGTLTFTAPADTRLAASTTYALVVEAIGTESVVYERTTSAAQDSGAASGWGIQDTYEWKDTADTWRDDTTTRALRISIRGTTRTPSTDATLSALSVSPKDIIGFDADRDSYQAGVAASVTRATVIATAADPGASVAYSGTDADTTADGHQIDLTAGRNTVTVTVTAEDTTTTEEYTVTVNRGVTAEYGWNAGGDIDGLVASGNNVPTGVWSNATTMWVANGDGGIHAYKTSDGTPDSTESFALASGNDEPYGIWSDGTTIWVSDPGADKLFAYKMSDKTHDSTKDFGTLAAANNNEPYGLWSDGATMWVVDDGDDKLYAYDTATKTRDSTKDFGTLAAASNNHPRGIWSDGTTMWVSDESDDKLYAYDTATKNRVADRDFDTLTAAGNTNPRGVWSDGTTLWVPDSSPDKVFSYNLPVYPVSAAVTGTSLTVTFNQDLGTTAPASSAFAVKKTPQGGTEGTVSLTGTPTIASKTVTLTLTSAVAATDTDVKISYTVPTGNKLANMSGTEVTAFTDLAVTNNTGATVPGQPTALTATASGTSQIDLAWTAPTSDGGASISGYKIETSTNGGTSYTVLVATQTATTYAHTGLTAASTHHYRVSAINSVGTGAVSATASATTATAATVPGQPTSLTATASGTTQIDLAWTAPTDDGGASISGYRIEVSADGGTSFRALIASPTGTSYSHTGLTANSTRHYRVSAVNSVGAGPASATATATTAGTAPGAPTNLTATANGSTRIDLAWTAPTNNGGSSITGYKIETSTNGTTFTNLVNTQTPTSYSHTGLSANTTRHYRVSAINSVGTSTASATASATTAGTTVTSTVSGLDARCGTTKAEQQTRCSTTHVGIYYGYGRPGRTQLGWRHPRTRPGIPRPDSYTVSMRTRGNPSDGWSAWTDQPTVPSAPRNTGTSRHYADFTPPDCGDAELRVRPNYTNNGTTTSGMPATATYWGLRCTS